MASLWGELKRRNVVRVAIAYVIVGWLILQFADVLIPLLTLPESVGRLIFLLLLIGFPLALFFAWAYELTPEGLKKEKEVDRSESITHITGRKLDFIIIGVLLVVLAMFAVERFVLLPDRAPATEAPQEIVATEIQQSIAVLPFANMSPDPDQEYFADGLAEEILNLLAKIPELKVIGRTSSFAFKGKNEDLRVIGEKLGVATLLEGSVRKSGDTVRITAQLIDTSDGAHIWSDTYNRTMTDIFAVQDDVAAAIIDALQLHITAIPARGRPTENAEAYALFLKARVSLNTSDNTTAEKLLLEAVELDPEFAEAYELLAHVYRDQTGRKFESAVGQKLMGDVAAKALEFDPDLIYAQAAYQIGNIESYSHLGEIEALERVLRASPNHTWAMDGLVFDLMVAGYLQEAVGVAERFVDLEPLSLRANWRLLSTLNAAGRRAEALGAREVYEQLYTLSGEWDLGVFDLVELQDEEAIKQFEAVVEREGLPSDWIRDLVTGARKPVTGQAFLDQRIQQIAASLPEGSAHWLTNRLTRWYSYFGFLDRYFELLLEKQISDKIWTDTQIEVDNQMIYVREAFTSHPKYLEVAEQLGLIEIWEQRGPPDFCEKVDGQWVCE